MVWMCVRRAWNVVSCVAEGVGAGAACVTRGVFGVCRISEVAVRRGRLNDPMWKTSALATTQAAPTSDGCLRHHERRAQP